MRLVNGPNRELLERTLRAAHRIEAPGVDDLEARERTERAIARARSIERRRRAVVTVATTLSVAAAVWLVVWRAWPAPPDPHAVVDVRPAVPTSPNDEPSARLPSGDRLVAELGARYEVESTGLARRVRLSRGEVLFDVARVEGGSFTVVAGDVSVRVRGTVFSVRLDHEVAVEVFEGAVEVRQGDLRVSLGPGDRWSAVVQPGEGEVEEAAPGLAPSPDEPSGLQPSSSRDLPARRAPGSERETPGRREASGHPDVELAPVTLLEARERLRARDFVGVLDACSTHEDADWQMLRADALRGLGRWREAAEAYDAAVQVLWDARRAQAGYAAARLWSESLDDPEAALASLTAGHATRPGSAIEERARVLEIELLLRLGRDPRARMHEYVGRFPETPTAAELQRRFDGEAEAPSP